MLGFWLIGMPVSLWLGFVAKGGVVGLWWGFVAGLTVVALMVIGRFEKLSAGEIRPVVESQ